MDIWVKIVLGRGNNNLKGPEVTEYLYVLGTARRLMEKELREGQHGRS